MEKKLCLLTCLLLSVMFVLTSFIGCSTDDMSQDVQEPIENPQDVQEPIENPQDVQEPIENPQDVQEPIENPQDVQEPIENPQDVQEPIQNPQDPAEELADARDFLYEAFLKNEISVANPYVEGMNLTVMDDKGYELEFEDVQKTYAYVDVNGDEEPELIFKISSYPDELMYILGICDNELVCFDVFETHTGQIAFGVYDNGFVWIGQNYDGFEMAFYTYTADGQPVEVRRFTEENEADIADYKGEEPEWIDWQYEEDQPAQ